MAKIPTLSDSPRLRASDPLSPTLSPGEAGKPFRQQAQLAGQVADSMFKLEKRQQAEADKVSYTKNNIALDQSFNEVSGQMQEEYRAGKPNYEGFAKDAMERMGVHKTFILEQTSESSKAATSMAFDQSMAQMQAKFKSMEASNKSQYAKVATEGTIDSLAVSSFKTWDPEGSLRNSNRMKGVVATSSQYSPKEKQALTARISKVNKDMVNGVLDRENPAEMRGALEDLNNPDLAPVFNDMDPKVIDKARVKLQKKLLYKNEEGLKEVRAKFSDSINSLQQGTLNPKNPEDSKILSNVKNELINRLGEDGKVMVDRIEAYEASYSELSDNAFDINRVDTDVMSSDISSDIKDPLKRSGSQATVKKILNSAKAKKQAELANDPASYIVKNDAKAALLVKEMLSPGNTTASKEFFVSMDSRFDRLGISPIKRKYLPKSLRDQYGGSIKSFIDSGDYKSASAVMDDMSARFGDNLGKVYDELDMDKKYEGFFEIQDPEARVRVMKNLMNEEEDINPRYKGNPLKQSDVDIKSTLRKDPMYQSIIGQDGGANNASGRTAESLLGMAQVEYKSAIINGSTMQEAKTKAWERISSKYEFIDNGDSPVAVDTSKHDPIKTKNFMRSTTRSDIDYVNKFNLKVLGNSSMEATNNQFKQSSKWSYNKKSDSLRLLVHENGSWRKAVTQDNKDVLIPLSDIDKMEDLPEIKSLGLSRREIFLN